MYVKERTLSKIYSKQSIKRTIKIKKIFNKNNLYQKVQFYHKRKLSK